MSSKSLISWSGGKDSCYATMLAKRDGLQPTVLLNVLNEQGKISRSHGIPKDILFQQANAMGLPIKMIESSWNDYEQKFIDGLIFLRTKYELTTAIFGDIDLQDHRDWEEKVCHKSGLQAILPLWKKDRKKLVLEMLDAGIETMIVSCNAQMGKEYLGKNLTVQLVEELVKAGIDSCGENGEYHTLVTNCPLFKQPLQIKVTGCQLHNNYWFSSLEI